MTDVTNVAWDIDSILDGRSIDELFDAAEELVEWSAGLLCDSKQVAEGLVGVVFAEHGERRIGDCDCLRNVGASDACKVKE